MGARYNTIREEEAMMKPDEIAEIYWHVHSQHKSAWTHELDVRPFPEKF
jgi:NADP-dependent 3-hydroxy acid dehydrogenase YdfG